MVVDIGLPEMTGSELCSALAVSGRGLPSILITGRNDSATQRLIEQAHPVAALFKPSTSAPCSMRSHERSLFQETNRRNDSRKDITIGSGDYDAALRGPEAALCFSRRVSRASGIEDHVLKREPSALLRDGKASAPWRVCAPATHLCTGLYRADALPPAVNSAELRRARRPARSR
jgi:CheY-like chemotaxis protein